MPAAATAASRSRHRGVLTIKDQTNKPTATPAINCAYVIAMSASSCSLPMHPLTVTTRGCCKEVTVRIILASAASVTGTLLLGNSTNNGLLRHWLSVCNPLLLPIDSRLVAPKRWSYKPAKDHLPANSRSFRSEEQEKLVCKFHTFSYQKSIVPIRKVVSS